MSYGSIGGDSSSQSLEIVADFVLYCMSLSSFFHVVELQTGVFCHLSLHLEHVLQGLVDSSLKSGSLQLQLRLILSRYR